MLKQHTSKHEVYCCVYVQIQEGYFVICGVFIICCFHNWPLGSQSTKNHHHYHHHQSCSAFAEPEAEQSL